MFTFLLIVHVIVSVLLIVIILMQQSKGGMGAMFGGSQDNFFGAGGDTFFTKATTILAVIFMITSLTLSYLSGKGPQQGAPRIPTEQRMPIEQSPLAPIAPPAETPQQTTE